MDGPMLKAYEAALLIVLVSTLALWVSSCAPKPPPPMDWQRTLDEAGVP